MYENDKNPALEPECPQLEHAFYDAPQEDEERLAFTALDPTGFFVRHPPKPCDLDTFITPDDKLFQTIHMGAAVVHPGRWKLVVDGLVRKSFALDLDMLRQMPKATVTSFHECFGSPVKPATHALWRIGNVSWTGVCLKVILGIAQPLPESRFVWSEGLDRGTFFGVTADRYQKDLPLSKAMCNEVLLAYEMNGQPLSKERGGPVRLVVPGWFGTNSTKWISKLTLQQHRAKGPYTTAFYNEPDPTSLTGATRPVWQVEVNSMITTPKPGAIVTAAPLRVEGWTWHEQPVSMVELSLDDGLTWQVVSTESREDFSWQRFHHQIDLEPGCYTLYARATDVDGGAQPLSGRRNHCHSVAFTVSDQAAW